MRYSKKDNFISALIGIAIGLPLSLYAVNHQTPHEQWYNFYKPEAEVHALTDEEMELFFTSAEVVEEVEEPVFPEKVMEVEEPDFIYIPLVNLSEDDQRTVFRICKDYDISFTLCLALIEHECGEACDTKQVSGTGDWGAMQINQCNHKWLESELGVIDFLDLEDNVNAGCFILKILFDKYEGNDHKVLMSYNMGERKASNLWNEGITSSRYSREIMDREAELSEYMDEQKGIEKWSNVK